MLSNWLETIKLPKYLKAGIFILNEKFIKLINYEKVYGEFKNLLMVRIKK